MTFQIIKIIALAFIQNISFTITSRSRNRDNKKFHLLAAFFSNTLWFLTFKELVTADMSFWLMIPYIFGTMVGSLYGMKISMKIEQWLGATADGHIKTK